MKEATMLYEDQVHNDMEIKETEQTSLPDGVILVEDILDITQSEILSSDDEVYYVVCGRNRSFKVAI